MQWLYLSSQDCLFVAFMALRHQSILLDFESARLAASLIGYAYIRTGKVGRAAYKTGHCGSSEVRALEIGAFYGRAC